MSEAVLIDCPDERPEEKVVLEGDAAIALWLEGKDEWNKWVEDNPEADVSFRKVNFSKYREQCDKNIISFNEYRFPNGMVDFLGATFGDGSVSFYKAVFGNGLINFIGATFGNGFVDFSYVKSGKGSVSFREADFGNGDVDFSCSEFYAERIMEPSFTLGYSLYDLIEPPWSIFDSVKRAFISEIIDWEEYDSEDYMESRLDFSYAKFGDGEVIFTEAILGCEQVSFIATDFGNGNVYFYGAMLGSGRVVFNNSKFGEGNLDFSSLNLCGKSYIFRSVNFKGFVDFSDLSASYLIDTFSLKNSVFEKSLELSSETIKCVPDLTHTKHSHQISLSELNCEFKRKGFLFFRKAVNNKDAVRLRRLKEIAESNKDHAASLRFHAEELKAKRWREFGFGASLLDYLFSGFSNYGQSIIKPALGLLGTIAAYTIAITSWSDKPSNWLCSLDLAIANAFPFISTSRFVRASSLKALGLDPQQPLPDWMGTASLVYGGFCFLFLFLLGLGLRNRFRI